MQAQDYSGVLWSIGLRSTHLTRADVEQAISDGSIVRTWPMRGTLHFLAASDVRWMLALLAPRSLQAAAGRYRQLELDEQTFTRAAGILERVLENGAHLTRAELFAALEADGIRTLGQRGIHILGWAAQNALICQGPMRGKQPTFVLLDRWAPPAEEIPRDEALARLALRYLAGHGPATDADLARWSGITLTDARAAISANSADLTEVKLDGVAYWSPRSPAPRSKAIQGGYLLPGFDEYILGYRDRGAGIAADHQTRIVPGLNGVFKPTVIVEGRVVGTWSRTLTRSSGSVAIVLFPECVDAQSADLSRAIDRLAAFHQVPMRVE
jgi:hypothetical protein